MTVVGKMRGARIVNVLVHALVRCLFLQQFGMGPRTFEDHGVLLQFVNQKPIASEMAFPSALIVSDQLMIAKLRREGLFAGDPSHGPLQPDHISSRLDSLPVVFLKPGGGLIIGSHEELPGSLPGLDPWLPEQKIYRKKE